MEAIVSFGNEVDFEENKVQGFVHIRTQKRTNRKCLTIIEGMPRDIDLKKVLKYFKKTFSCNGAIFKDEETEDQIMQLTGDNRREVAAFLKEEQIVNEDCIKIHGA
jgi:translation initiation factor 1